jgi:uncharacterized protein
VSYPIKTLVEHLDASNGSKRILALDGGGVRGMLTLSYLKVMEDLLRQRHGNDPNFRLSDYFDLIAGTSTGAIIASALACGLSVEFIQEKYRALATQVFRAGFLRWGIIRPKFDTHALELALKDESVLGESTTLGSPRLLTGLMVMSKRLDTGSPWPLTNNPKAKYYGRRPGSLSIPNADYPLWKIVRASTAAPHFFKPEKMTITSQVIEGKTVVESGDFVDGGVSTANNPALQAYQVATLQGFNLNWQPGTDRLLLISVGSGRTDPKRRVIPIAAGHAVTALAALMDDCSNLVETQLQWMSNSPTARKIDSEIGNLGGDLIAGHPLLTYQRYNVEFSRKWLKENLKDYETQVFRDEKTGENLMRGFSKMDDPKMLDQLEEIGRIAAQNQMELDHFPPGFDLSS